jgi:hypothetical protein
MNIRIQLKQFGFILSLTSMGQDPFMLVLALTTGANR